MSTHIFIIFHSKIFDECYSRIPRDVLKNNFTFVAVNPTIPKSYTQNKYNVINEWELPVYNPDLQRLNHKENSVLHHVHANGLHLPHKKVGFFQYDMNFNKINMVKFLHNMDPRLCYVFDESDYHHAFITTYWMYDDYKELIFNDYEKHFNKKIDFNRTFPLFNSFIIDSTIYSKMMNFLSPVYIKYTHIIDNNSSNYIAGLYERFTALVLSQEDLYFEKINHIHHDLELKRQAC